MSDVEEPQDHSHTAKLEDSTGATPLKFSFLILPINVH